LRRCLLAICSETGKVPASGERAYAYAKACGILGKSFIGPRIARLAGVARLADLDRLIFPEKSAELPERELLVDLERRISHRTVQQILKLVANNPQPAELLVWLIRSYEYADLKNALNAVSVQETALPLPVDLGRFSTVDFSAYPHLPTMLRGTEFSWILAKDDPAAMAVQTELDQRYYQALWAALHRTSRGERMYTQRLLAEEIGLKNCVWALRLRLYYGYAEAEIRQNLVDLDYQGVSLMADALATLNLATDQRADWRGWNREYLLNPEKPGESWRVDPRYVQNAAANRLYRQARLYFRRRPFSLDATACFIKLKQFEENLLTSVAEGLALGMSSRDVVSLLEVRP